MTMKRPKNADLSLDDELLAALSTQVDPQQPDPDLPPVSVTKADHENAKLRAQIEALLKQNAELIARTEIEEEPESPEGVASFSRSATKERVEISIEPPHTKHDDPYTFVSVNGRAYLITRGERVAVPPEVITALQHAVQTKHYTVTNPDGTQDWKTRDNRRFAFQVYNRVIDKNGKPVNEPYLK